MTDIDISLDACGIAERSLEKLGMKDGADMIRALRSALTAASGNALFDALAGRLIRHIMDAEVDRDPPTDIELRLVAIIRERDSLRLALTASEKRAAEFEAAFKDSNASFQIAFKGCGERNTLLRDLRSYVLAHGSEKDMAPLIERIDQMVRI